METSRELKADIDDHWLLTEDGCDDLNIFKSPIQSQTIQSHMTSKMLRRWNGETPLVVLMGTHNSCAYQMWPCGLLIALSCGLVKAEEKQGTVNTFGCFNWGERQSLRIRGRDGEWKWFGNGRLFMKQHKYIYKIQHVTLKCRYRLFFGISVQVGPITSLISAVVQTPASVWALLI